MREAVIDPRTLVDIPKEGKAPVELADSLRAIGLGASVESPQLRMRMKRKGRLLTCVKGSCGNACRMCQKGDTPSKGTAHIIATGE
jgi:hypothetical protein